MQPQTAPKILTLLKQLAAGASSPSLEFKLTSQQFMSLWATEGVTGRPEV